MRHLVGRPHLHALAIVDPHQTAVRLDERLMHARHGEAVLDHQLGFCKPDIDIAAGEHVMDEAIGRLLQWLGKSFIAADVRVNDRRAFLQSRYRIEDRRQLFVVDLNEI